MEKVFLHGATVMVEPDTQEGEENKMISVGSRTASGELVRIYVIPLPPESQERICEDLMLPNSELEAKIKRLQDEQDDSPP